MRWSLVTAATVGLGIVAACEIPAAPEWDIGVVVPYTSDTVSALDFLPSAVSVDTVGVTPVFVTQPQTDSVEFRLDRMCSLCQLLNGLTVQVPSFEYIDSLDVTFPSELVTIHVISALLEIRVTNGLNFDPLRPNPDPASTGYITLVARDIASGGTIDSSACKPDLHSIGDPILLDEPRRPGDGRPVPSTQRNRTADEPDRSRLARDSSNCQADEVL